MLAKLILAPFTWAPFQYQMTSAILATTITGLERRQVQRKPCTQLADCAVNLVAMHAKCADALANTQTRLAEMGIGRN